MKNKSLYELGKMAQDINEILIRKYSFCDEDRYQFIILKLIEGRKIYKF